jgi:hypothetical protein
MAEEKEKEERKRKEKRRDEEIKREEEEEKEANESGSFIFSLLRLISLLFLVFFWQSISRVV